MAKSSEDLSSKRHFHWTNKVSNEDEEAPPTLKPPLNCGEDEKKKENNKASTLEPVAPTPGQRRKLQAIAVSRLRSVLTLATPISGLVREMASGLVRIALESGRRLVEEPVWRTYCNGKKCGFATRRECGPKEWKILKAVEPISMGAGVLPGGGDGEEGGVAEGGCGGGGGGEEVMYMRAKFERVVGSRDSEAFYMMNPDSNGAPELSVYLLRV
ncbi:hypothetical protein CsSME_00006593 [Camellia sinensis var. sinensis]